jgi:hypothetical protein
MARTDASLKRRNRVDSSTANVEKLARYIHRHCAAKSMTRVTEWKALGPDGDRTRDAFRELARGMVRDFDQLEEILGELLSKSGRF